MGDTNPIRTLGDYSRPSHKGYRNTIELHDGNNRVPLQSDTIWSEDVCGITTDMMRQVPLEPSRQEAFEDLVMNFILDQEEKVKQLEEYVSVIGSDFMQLFLEVIVKLMKEIRMEENKSLCVKHARTIFPSLPLVRESTFGFKPGVKNNQNIKSRHDAENASPQSSPQVLPSFEVYTLPVTYSKEVEETIGISIEVEHLDHTKLEDLGLNTCSHDIFLISKEIPSVGEPEP
nr:ribonuclease H-like domain-containing protein [Tanacetum cinerariifolium]